MLFRSRQAAGEYDKAFRKSEDFKKDISIIEKDKFDRNRRAIEDNLDLYRENLTFLNNEQHHINRFMSVIHEQWKARRDDINDNKLHYSKLIVQKIRDYHIGDIDEGGDHGSCLVANGLNAVDGNELDLWLIFLLSCFLAQMLLELE